MAFSRVAQSYLNLSGTSTVALDTTTQLTTQAGDLLFFIGCFNADSVASFADVDGGNVATLFPRVGDGSSGYLRTGYVLSATAGTKNFRMSLTVASTYSWICVLQYRPGSGYVAAFDTGPSPSAVTTSSTPTSGAITTTGPGLIVGAMIHEYLQTSTSPLIGGDTAGLYPPSGFGAVFFGALDLITTAAKTAATARVSIDGWRTWVMDVASFKEVASGGGSVDVTPSGISVATHVGSPVIGNVQSTSPFGTVATPSLGKPDVVAVQSVAPAGIVVALELGKPAVSSIQSVAPVGMATSPSLGVPTISTGQEIALSGLVVSVLAGRPSVENIQATAPSSLASVPRLGRPTVSTGQEITPVGLAVSVQLSRPSVANVQASTPVGLASSPTLGRPTVGTDDQVSPTGIVAGSVLGRPMVSNVQGVDPNGLISTPQVGLLALTGPEVYGPTIVVESTRIVKAIIEDSVRIVTADFVEPPRVVSADIEGG